MTLIFRLLTISFILLASKSVWSQLPIGMYKDFDNHFLYLENDSTIRYQLLIGTRGSTKHSQAGIGLYKTFGDTILIWTVDSLIIEDPGYEMTYEWDTTNLNHAGVKKTFTFDFTAVDEIILSGPILENYESLNRKKYWKGFLNWPWRWSFKKEHWFDPGAIVLLKE